MYPNELIFGITLYDICFAGGVLAALICFRLLADKTKMSAKLFNFCLMTAVFAVIGGYLSSVLFQAVYNYEETGVFEINAGTGMTFYGGLIGGAAVFILIYFVIGHFVFPGNDHVVRLPHIARLAACSIPLAHAIGRIGCLMAGCCHGIATDSVFGVHMWAYTDEKVLPVQLYESIFLFCLFAVLLRRALRHAKCNLQIYMIAYGVWRFAIEYLRGDDRGGTFISFLSPSQLTALVLIIGGAFLIWGELKFIHEPAANDEQEN